MWLKSLQIKNVKGFSDTGLINFSEGINVVIGANSSGKSTILRCLQLLQPVHQDNSLNQFFQGGLRVGCEKAEVAMEIQNPNRKQMTVPDGWDFNNWQPGILFTGNPNQFQLQVRNPANSMVGYSQVICHQIEPNNFIFPYFSNRRPAQYQLQVNPTHANAIQESILTLPSKIDRLLSVDSKYLEQFRNACQEILGIKISCVQYGDGKHAGLVLEDGTLLPIDRMGHGVAQVLAFLAHLCSATGKLFLIEEVENDLHPKALKCLLDFIISKSAKNQFVISTHNNIVLRQLGCAPKSKIFSVVMEINEASGIPMSSCREISDKPEDRIEVLEKLGYEPSDFYLWKGYLVLEESTAGTIIDHFLIPYLVPALQGKIKVISAGGVARVESRISKLHEIFVFLHTAPQYEKRAWVVVDGGKDGEAVVSRLQSKFSTWPKEHFRTLSAEQFEKYYPTQFQERATQILAMPDKNERREAKGELAKEVLAWAIANRTEAEVQFKECAAEVLAVLEEINKSIG